MSDPSHTHTSHTVLKLPLRYFNKTFHHCLVDHDREILIGLGPLSVQLPRSVRRITNNRPDISLALLTDDPSLRRRIYPFWSFAGTQVQLAHVVLRPAIVDVMFDSSPGMDNELARFQLNSIRATIGKVAYDNLDHTDCRLSNLREIKTQS